MEGLEYAIKLFDKGFESGIRKAKKQTEGLDGAVNKAGRNIKKTTDKGKAQFGGLKKAVKKVGVAIAAAFAIGAVINFGNEVVRTTAKFEGFENAIMFASG